MTRRPTRTPCGLGLIGAALAIAAATPVRAQSGEEGRCWVALRLSGPESMRTTEEEARDRLRARCRQGDILVYLTDTGQPFGPVAALYCDMSRPVLIERSDGWRSHDVNPNEDAAPIGLMTCTYRGGPRPER
jgi:hypothetical protein